MRITVSLVVNLIANGMSVPEMIQEYPELEAEDVRQAYASALANEERSAFTDRSLRVKLLAPCNQRALGSRLHVITAICG